MKAIVCTKYGPPEVLQFKEVEKPAPKYVKFGLTLVHVIILTAVIFMVAGFEAEGEESILTRQYDFTIVHKNFPSSCPLLSHAHFLRV